MVRYEVTELIGRLSIGNLSGNAREGLSCHVIDTAWNRRMVATYRSEDYRGGTTHEQARHAARRHAYRLNASL